MLRSTCKHCLRQITYEQGHNGFWFEETRDAQLGAQYCWKDPVAGSQHHEPDLDTVKEATE